MKFCKVTNVKNTSKQCKLAEFLAMVFQNYNNVISACIAQLDVNKPFKQTKRDLKPILSLSFNRKNHFIKYMYSVVLTTKLDKEINIFIALTLKIVRFCFL